MAVTPLGEVAWMLESVLLKSNSGNKKQGPDRSPVFYELITFGNRDCLHNIRLNL